MGQLYLVRHGQASLGAANYDQLSELGLRQSERLGAYWQDLGLQFDAVMTGTLTRHAQTLAGIAHGLGQDLPAQTWPGLNEYDAEAVIATVHPGLRERPTTPEAYRQHFRLLRQGLLAWMRGEAQPHGMPNWPDFVNGVMSALQQAQQHHAGNVLVVSSGGPISVALGQLLGAPAESSIELNLQMRNTSVSELRASAVGHRVVSFNTLPHLADAEYANWVTYA
jgi:broad specificity phosphatase PhoE